MYSNTIGANNVSLGAVSLYSNVDGSQNTACGMNALRTNVSGSGCVALGYAAGYRSTDSNCFFVNNIDEGSIANEKAYSLLYGTFSGAATSLAGQQLTINGTCSVNGTIQTTLGKAWDLGEQKSAVSGETVDLGHYVEIKIDGTTYKLAVLHIEV